jgi:hypothetical protein
MLNVQQQKKEQAERRKYPRLTINADLTYNKFHDTDMHSGFCKNLSYTGILFITEQNLSPGDSVFVTLDTKSSNFTPLKARVEVVRTQPADSKYTVAGKITEYK